jgi:hypothetical protein
MPAIVKLETIIEALEFASDSTSSYLDLETGEVLTLTEEECSLAADPLSADQDLPEWQREQVELARRISRQGQRYVELPDQFDINEWDCMQRFSETLQNPQLRDHFIAAIHRTGAFRNFKHLLDMHHFWDAWNRFRQDHLEQIASDWCEEHGISLQRTQS